MNEPKLERCPHCGSDKLKIDSKRTHMHGEMVNGHWRGRKRCAVSVRCTKCNARGPVVGLVVFDGQYGECDIAGERAAEAWNRRAPLPDNKALTVDELREMDGQPIWFVDLENLSDEWRILESVWSDDVTSEFEWQARDITASDEYADSWLAYRRPPDKE